MITAALVWLTASMTILAVCWTAAYGDACEADDEGPPIPRKDAAVSIPLGIGRGDVGEATGLRAHCSPDECEPRVAAGPMPAADPRERYAMNAISEYLAEA